MIVVTGGAGFIGSNLVAALCQRAGDVVVADRLGHDDKWRNLAKHFVAEFVAPERLIDFLNANVAAVETIFHLGASSSTTERDVDFIVSNNFTLSLALWRWCSKNEVPLIYASSAATYGGGEHGFDDDSEPEALAKLRPLNPYGWSKHLFDRIRHRRIGRVSSFSTFTAQTSSTRADRAAWWRKFIPEPSVVNRRYCFVRTGTELPTGDKVVILFGLAIVSR
jgi:ADP-L-glycero-D-manno-heptose 6-epimerase